MKNYIIGLLVVIVLFLASVIYKRSNTTICGQFPVPESLKKESTDIPFYIFLVFSKKNCMPCILEIVEVLNTLPANFRAAGIVPEEELKDEVTLKRVTGITFPLFRYQDYRKYLPWGMPTIFGVSPAGRIIFVLPGIEGQKSYLRDVLTSIYGERHQYFDK